MNRNHLFHRIGEEVTLEGTIDQITTSPRRYVLVNVMTDEGEWFADHLWVNKTKAWADIRLKLGDKIRLQATIELYQKRLEASVGVGKVHHVELLGRPYEER